MESNKEPDHLINKIIISAGTKPANFKKGTKVTFHYVTQRVGSETIIDDSRKINGGKPMELIIGKQFKLEVWEVIVQKMAINEIARFDVHKTLVSQYPFISRTLRDVNKPPDERRSHCCAMSIQNAGVGYKDLDDLLQNPSDLQFTIHLLNAVNPEDYEPDSWQLSEEQKLESVHKLKEKGNIFFKSSKLVEASDSYAKAIGILEQLMLKEKPRDTEWLELRSLKLPLLLNYAQCKLSLNDYYPVITHCTEVLEIEPDNVKGLFRRARAYLEVWEPQAARNDFTRAAELDPSLKGTVQKYFFEIDRLQREKDQYDKEKLKNLF